MPTPTSRTRPAPRRSSRTVLARRTLAALANPNGEIVPLEGLLAHTRPAYGARTWAGAIDVLMRDEVYAKVVHDLLADLHAGVAFREPVRIQTRRGRRILNGMHRTTAHVLAGSSTILATTVEDPTPLEMVELAATLVGRTATDKARLDDLDHVMDAWLPMMSMPVGDVWAEPAFMASSGRRTELAWYLPHRAADTLVASVRNRAAQAGYDLVVHSLELTDTSA